MEPTVNFSQQHNLFDPRYARKVTLIGAGSVGSIVARMLASVGVTDLTVWDADSVESHNVPMSEYRQGDLARPKVEALADIIREHTGVEISAVRGMYAGGTLEGAVVCCVDSMEARKLLWDEARLNPGIDLFVDTRTAAELVSVFAVNPVDPDDVEYYDAFHYPSKDAVRPMCGLHGIITVSSVAAAAAVTALTRWWEHGTKRRHFKMLVGELDVIGE